MILKSSALLILLLTASTIYGGSNNSAQGQEVTARTRLIAQNNDDEGARPQRKPAGNDQQTQAGGNVGFRANIRNQNPDDAEASMRARRLREFRERMRQSTAGAEQSETDMPSFKIRRRFGNGGLGNTGDGNGADDMPPRPFRGNGDGFPGRQFQGNGSGPDEMPGRQFRGNGGENGGGSDDMPFRRRAVGQGGPGMPGGFQPGMGRNFRPGGNNGGRGQAQGPFGGRSLDLTPLALTEDQKQKVKQMREQTRDKMKEIRKNLTAKQVEMRNLLFNPDVSDAQIRAARVQVRQLQDQMDETNMNDLLSIRSMLTPEQRKRLPECMPGRNATAGGARGGPQGVANRPGFQGPEGPPGMFPPHPPPGPFANQPQGPPPSGGVAEEFNARGDDLPQFKRKNNRARRSFEAENDNSSSN